VHKDGCKMTLTPAKRNFRFNYQYENDHNDHDDYGYGEGDADADADDHYAEIDFISENDFYFITNLNDYYKQHRNLNNEVHLEEPIYPLSATEYYGHCCMENCDSGYTQTIPMPVAYSNPYMSIDTQEAEGTASARALEAVPSASSSSSLQLATRQIAARSFGKLIRQTKKCRRNVVTFNSLVKNLINGRQRLASDGNGVYHRARRRTCRAI